MGVVRSAWYPGINSIVTSLLMLRPEAGWGTSGFDGAVVVVVLAPPLDGAVVVVVLAAPLSALASPWSTSADECSIKSVVRPLAGGREVSNGAKERPSTNDGAFAWASGAEGGARSR